MSDEQAFIAVQRGRQPAGDGWHKALMADLGVALASEQRCMEKQKTAKECSRY